MPALATDFISLNRGGTPTDGASGTYLVAPIQDIVDIAAAGGTIVSADAGQLLVAGGDGGAFIDQATIQANETVTTLAYTAGTQALTYTDENGTPTVLDLSALATDLQVDGASIDAGGLITFTVNDAGTATDFTLDMSTFVNSAADTADSGSMVFGTGGGTTTLSKTGWMSFPLAP